MITLDWAEFKDLLTQKNIPLQYVDFNNRYLIVAFDGPLEFDTIIKKTNPASTEQLDFEDNYKNLPTTNKSYTDTDGSPLTRTKITKAGWHFQLHSVEFTTSLYNSLYNKDVDGNDLSFTSIKFYDAEDGGNELYYQEPGYELETDIQFQLRLDTNCKRTEIFWEVDHDIEVIGGVYEQVLAPTSDIRMWIIAAPDIPVAYGGSVPFIQGGLNLRHLSDKIDLDGKTPKEMKYDVNYHTNKFKIVLKHGAGVQHPINILFKIFRLNS